MPDWKNQTITLPLVVRLVVKFHTWMCHLHDPESKWSCHDQFSSGRRCWSRDLLFWKHHGASSSRFVSHFGRSRQKGQCLWSSTPTVQSHLEESDMLLSVKWAVPQPGSHPELTCLLQGLVWRTRVQMNDLFHRNTGRVSHLWVSSHKVLEHYEVARHARYHTESKYMETVSAKK